MIKIQNNSVDEKSIQNSQSKKAGSKDNLKEINIMTLKKLKSRFEDLAEIVGFSADRRAVVASMILEQFEEHGFDSERALITLTRKK